MGEAMNPAQPSPSAPPADTNLSAPAGAPPPRPPGPTADLPPAANQTQTARAGSLALRQPLPAWQAVLLGLASVALVLAAWWYVTRGESGEERIISAVKMPSPRETLEGFPSLWFNQALTRNLLVSLRRLVLGFGLAALVGVPVGILCGCFTRVHAFFVPWTIFGRNAPMAALISLTFTLFGTGELQKVMFLFLACVAFIISDAARAVADVGSQYVDTAYTLGATRRQVITKVLVPLAMPDIFNSLRLLFGLAFGYIMLVETFTAEGLGGVGYILNFAMSRGGKKEHIYLVLMIIPLVALGIDRVLYWVQRQLFPYRYGTAGLLHGLVYGCLKAWEDVWSWIWPPRAAWQHLSLPSVQQQAPTS
jgi:NitT/TauT family transport system permease protein